MTPLVLLYRLARKYSWSSDGSIGGCFVAVTPGRMGRSDQCPGGWLEHLLTSQGMFFEFLF
jgi:hypothetical protein